MRSTADHGLSVTVSVSRSRMCCVVQITGAVVLGSGLAAAVGLDPGLLFAAHTAGMGLTLLPLGAASLPASDRRGRP
jgi:hypothetical protein